MSPEKPVGVNPWKSCAGATDVISARAGAGQNHADSMHAHCIFLPERLTLFVIGQTQLSSLH